MCVCEGPWRGEDCSQRVEEGWWEVVDTETDPDNVVTPSRTSHGAVADGADMWVVGGEFLHHAPADSMVSQWSMESRQWSVVRREGGRPPSER